MDEFNETLITLTGYVEMNKYRYLYFFVFFTVYVLIICSNGTIVYLIWTHKNLHEPMYIFIGALLFNSVIYSSTFYPKLLTDFLSDKQVIPYSGCIFQYFVFYSVGGSEFLLLAVMAFDRYVSICKPLRYPTIMRKTTVKHLLVFAWLFPSLHVVLQAALSTKSKICDHNLEAIFCNNTIYALQCMRSRTVTIIGVVILFDVAVLPVLFTVFTYAKIFIMAYQSNTTSKRKAAKTCVPHLLVLISFSYLCVYDVILARVESHLPKAARFVMMLQLFLYHPLLNPIIYGLKMKEISKHLKTLFCSTKV
ncbi:olfactory receptor 11A1-like [Poeciliopsis prolifica]|uniref:olfactory receptor 11A1-like n=1 Tax=Poeciliopsis prolifica TaxID=188132 RepID=UPI002413D3D5|nr:olfactory receptor 11A1-like [Poeciliopsis prolifica]